MKVYHVHTDDKFVNSTRFFFFGDIQNYIYFIGDRTTYKGSYVDEVQFISKNKLGIQQVINECRNADLVVLYELNFLKAYIANRLPKNVKIVWRFFGTELYTRIPKRDVFSSQTIKLLKADKTITSTVLQRILNPLKTCLKWRTGVKTEFNRAIKSVDFFVGLSITEYQYLQQRFSHLPTFIQNPFIESKVGGSVKSPNSNRIAIGNSKNAFNNHLEILDILKDNKGTRDYEFVLLHNYGVENNYAHEVRSRAKLIEGVTIVEEFLDRETFKSMYEGFCALVINGYRQMAMGNIFIALRSGVKVYLNEYNVIYEWLLAEGFKVYSVNAFSDDLSSGNCQLDHGVAEYNRQQFVKLTKKYSLENFQNTIYELASMQKQGD